MPRTPDRRIAPPATKWRDDAKCRDENPDLYLLEHLPDHMPRVEKDAEAAALCHGCPVLRDCAADAWLHEDIGVVRGGVWLRRARPNALAHAATETTKETKK